MRRGKRLKAFLTERNTTLGATGAAKTFTIAGGTPNITVTAHGYTAGMGPFTLTTTGTLPTGLALLTQYWVASVVDANTITLATRRGTNVPTVAFTNATGSGVHTITKAGTRGAFAALLQRLRARVIAASTDVDNL
jgi:hypothetical protein